MNAHLAPSSLSDPLDTAEVTYVPVAATGKGGPGGRLRQRFGPAALRLLGWRVVALLVFVGIWQLLTAIFAGPGSGIPGAPAIVLAGYHLIGSSSLWVAVGHTASSTVIGIVICAVAGTGIGLLVTSNRWVLDGVTGVVDFVRTVPPLAVIPVLLLVLGPTARMEIILCVAAAVWPVLLHTVSGVANLDQELIRTARAYRIGGWRRFGYVVLPSAAPFVATGIRIAATLVLLVALSTELLAGVPGLGQNISAYEQAGQGDRVYACVALAGLLGVALNMLLKAAEQRLLAWHFQPRLSVDRS